jgi:hypothetical protein
MSHESSEAAPINSVEAMFDGIVMQERKMGLAIELHSSGYRYISPINGMLLDASDEYKAAMHRRLGRLLNNRPGKERLHYESESFAMNLRSIGPGKKCVRYIAMYVPITEDELCHRGCDKKDHECVRHRKQLSVVFIFDTEPVDLAQTTRTYLSKRRHGRMVFNYELDGDEGFAGRQAHRRTQEVTWDWWCGNNALDLNSVWLYIFDALKSIASETTTVFKRGEPLGLLTRVNLPPALNSQDRHDRLISWRSGVPLSSSPGDNAIFDYETTVALEYVNWPCVHGNTPGSCKVCDDQS